MFTDPRKSNSGLFSVDWFENYPAWRAWREWQAEAFGKRLFPQKLTVPMAWPPETSGGTQIVVDWLKKIRDEVEKDGPKNAGGPCKSIPDLVVPWRGWADDLKRDVAEAEILRRKEWGSTFDHAPKYPARHRMGYRFPTSTPRAGSQAA